MQADEILPYTQIYKVQTGNCPRKGDLLNGSLKPGDQETRYSCNNHKETNMSASRRCHSIRSQSSKKGKRKTREISGACRRIQEKLWNMKVTVILILVGALVTVPEKYEEELGWSRSHT